MGSVEPPAVLVERTREALRALGPLVAEAEGPSALPMQREAGLEATSGAGMGFKTGLGGAAGLGLGTGAKSGLRDRVKGYLVPHRFAKWLRDPEKLAGIEGFQCSPEPGYV